ncbi:glycosyltransferase family 87 protein [Frigoriglobus tundricola]|uniref:DUF2029 domain-containing protein n=1 Tax=Frigoriglobus tundricola TaxID=2774151 RepID=A0A6M5YRZ4_9BACT|nr:glycosyltransferase family 87 protein [Frigoriglobus tundricola]QJW96194.1 hypothetical protein FTUN_3751 [Frigoriglobus tundricola]
MTARRPAVRGASILAVGVLTAFAVYQALGVNLAPDFFIYRAGAEMGLRRESPYDGAKIRARVADQYPEEPILSAECGFFLPPQAVLVFAPFALLPYSTAKVFWALLNGLCAAAVIRVSAGALAARPLPLPLGGQLLLPLVLAWNYLTVAAVELGQTSLMLTGCIAAGLWAFDRGRPARGVALWSVAFIKPHLALPLVPLAWYLGGWKRSAALVALVVALNLVGATLAGGSPLFLADYVAYIGSSHKAVMFNRAGSNPEITSWNRLLFALTEPFAGDRFLIELTATLTAAGYLVWFVFVAGRGWLARAKPSAAWAVTAAVVGAVLCAQVQAYELLVLALAVPWVRELYAGGFWVRGSAAAALLLGQLVPLDVAGPLGIWTHRPLGVALLAVLVLMGPVGPLNRAPTPPPVAETTTTARRPEPGRR